MSLVNMRELLKDAEERNYGIGSFSIANMEMTMGAIRAAEELNSPIIIQIAQARLKHSPLEMIGPLMVSAAKTATVPVAVHLDHGLDIETIHKALDLGFTSVMIDASHLPLKDNIEIVRKVKTLADTYGAAVEAEVGQVGGSEDSSTDLEMLYSNPMDVVELYKETQVDAIALSIGNIHGLYKSEPRLKFDLLEEVRSRVNLPLVLHGGSGISDEDFRRCIKGGIKKLNIATVTFLSVEGAVREYCREERRDYFALSTAMVQGAYENVLRHIRVFESDEKVQNMSMVSR